MKYDVLRDPFNGVDSFNSIEGWHIQPRREGVRGSANYKAPGAGGVTRYIPTW